MAKQPMGYRARPQRSPQTHAFPRVWLVGVLSGLVALLTPTTLQPSLAATHDTIDQACFTENGQGRSAGQDILAGYFPGQPEVLSKALCQLLLFPTASLLDTDDFSSQIANGSISSDSRQASAETMTLPSLWWNRDSLTPQLGGRRLVMSWIAYEISDSGRQVVDVMINPQIWSVLTFNERFAVLNQFGTSARNFGYDLRFFHGSARNQRLAGIYACESKAASPTSASAPLDTSTPHQRQVCTASLDVARIVQMQRSLAAAGDRATPVAETTPAEPAAPRLGLSQRPAR
jgi:hypothetical protein